MQANDKEAKINALLKKLFDRLPDSADVLLKLVRDLESHDQAESAFAILRRAVNAESIPSLHREFAVRCLRRSYYEAALRHLEAYLGEARGDTPDKAEDVVLMAAIQSGLGRTSTVEKLLEQARSMGIRESRIESYVELSPGSGDGPSGSSDAEGNADETLVIDSQGLEATEEEKRRRKAGMGNALGDSDDGDWSAMKTGSQSEKTQQIRRPAAPFESGLILARVQASLRSVEEGDTDPFRPAMEEDSEPEPEPENKTPYSNWNLESSPGEDTHKKTIEDELPAWQDMSSSESEDKAVSSSQSDGTAGNRSEGTAESVGDTGQGRPQAEDLAWDRLPSDRGESSSGMSQSEISSQVESETRESTGEVSTDTDASVASIESRSDSRSSDSQSLGNDRPREMPTKGTSQSQSGSDPRGASQGRADSEESTAWGGVESGVLSREMLLKGGLPGLLVLSLVGWFMVSSVQYGRLAAVAEEASQARDSDSYDGHLEALGLLENGEAQTRLLPGVLDRIIFGVFPAFPGRDVSERRRIVRAQGAELAAFVEWRFEWDGARQWEGVERGIDDDSAFLLAANTYWKLLAGESEEAIELGRQNWERNPEHPAAQRAMAAALLRHHESESVDELIAAIERREGRSVWEQFLVVELERRRLEGDGDNALREFVTEYPEQVEGQIEVAAVATGDGDREASRKRLERLVGESEARLSPYQKARVFQALGMLASREGNLEVGRDYYAKSLKEVPVRHELYPGAIDFFIDQGNYRQAEVLLDNMAAHVEGAPAEWVLRRAQVALHTGRATEVEEIARAMKAPMATLQWVEGMAYLQVGQAKKAEEVFQRLAQEDTNEVGAEAFSTAAALSSSPGDDDEVLLEKLQELAGEHDDQPRVHQAYALGARAVADKTISRTQRNRLNTEANEQLRAALDLASDDIFSRYELCGVLIELGREQEAEQVCMAAFDSNPAFRPGVSNVVRLRLRQGRSSEALEVLSDIEERLGEDWGIKALEVQALTAMRRFDEAAQRLDEMEAQVSETTEIEFAMLKGRLAFAQHDYEQARERFEWVNQEASDDDEAGYWLGHTLVRLGEWDDANDLLLELLAAPYWGGYAWYALGELRRRQEQFSDAQTNLNRAKERLEPHIVPPRLKVLVDVELARAYQTRYGWDRAEVSNYLESARQRAGEEDVPELLMTEGSYRFKRRQPYRRAAREALETALEIDPHLCEGWQVLQEVYEAQRAREKLRGLSERIPEECV